jgi:hypothetical protein
MKRQAIALVRAAGSHLADETGQAMTEYASVSFLLLASGIAVSVNWNIFKYLFIGMQTYISFYFFALNCAVG